MFLWIRTDLYAKVSKYPIQFATAFSILSSFHSSSCCSCSTCPFPFYSVPCLLPCWQNGAVVPHTMSVVHRNETYIQTTSIFIWVSMLQSTEMVWRGPWKFRVEVPYDEADVWSHWSSSCWQISRCWTRHAVTSCFRHGSSSSAT